MAMGSEAEHCAGTGTPFPTAIRGYDRSAVDETVRTEADRFHRLQDRIASLQRELAALSTATDVPNRKRTLRRALDLLADGWDDALRTTAETEHAIGRDRARAEGEAAAALRLTLRECAEVERRAQEDSDRLVAAAREDAKQIAARANAELDRAMGLATDTTKTAAVGADRVAREFADAFRTLAVEADNEMKDRQVKADFDLETAQAQLETARLDATAVLDRAAAQREATLDWARAQVAAIETANAGESTRVQAETDQAVAELANLMLQAGPRLNGSDGPNGASGPSAAESIAAELPDSTRPMAS